MKPCHQFSYIQVKCTRVNRKSFINHSQPSIMFRTLTEETLEDLDVVLESRGSHSLQPGRNKIQVMSTVCCCSFESIRPYLRHFLTLTRLKKYEGTNPKALKLDFNFG